MYSCLYLDVQYNKENIELPCNITNIIAIKITSNSKFLAD